LPRAVEKGKEEEKGEAGGRASREQERRERELGCGGAAAVADVDFNYRGTDKTTI
jgi:hypothetical protein